MVIAPSKNARASARALRAAKPGQSGRSANTASASGCPSSEHLALQSSTRIFGIVIQKPLCEAQ